MISMILL